MLCSAVGGRICRCKVVSKGWRSLYSTQDLLKLRRSEGVAEEYLVCFPGANPSVCQGQLYYPLAGKWRKIPPTPVELHSYGLVRDRGSADGRLRKGGLAWPGVRRRLMARRGASGLLPALPCGRSLI